MWFEKKKMPLVLLLNEAIKGQNYKPRTEMYIKVYECRMTEQYSVKYNASEWKC